MTNKEAIELLNSMKSDPVDYGELVGAPSPYLGIHYVHTEPEDYAIDLAIKALEQQEKDKWIPVSEGLPERDGDYLCSFEFDGRRWICVKPYGLTNYQESSRSGITQKYIGLPVRKYFYEPSYNRELENIIAWKPMPEEYKGGI